MSAHLTFLLKSKGLRVFIPFYLGGLYTRYRNIAVKTRLHSSTRASDEMISSESETQWWSSINAENAVSHSHGPSLGGVTVSSWHLALVMMTIGSYITAPETPITERQCFSIEMLWMHSLILISLLSRWNLYEGRRDIFGRIVFLLMSFPKAAL